jgi:PAS domain S-box-containing protein
MFSFFKNRLAAKIALTMAIPLLVNLFLYGEMQRQLVLLEKLTDDLSVRRQIVERVNNIVIANYFALQSLMQYKMFGRVNDRESYQHYVNEYRSQLQNLADTLAKRPGEEANGAKLHAVGKEYVAALAGSQFSPDEQNQVASFFDNLERNQRLKKASVEFLQVLKSVGRKAQADVDKASSEEGKSRAAFRDFCQFTILANSLVALLIALLVARIIVKRINVVRSNSQRLARGIPLIAGDSSGDEIGELDRTFREMASALESAREKELEMLAEIEESHDELTMVINKIPAALFITDGSGRVVSLNTVAHELFAIDISYFDGAALDKLFRVKAAQKEGFFKRLIDDTVSKPVSLFAVGSDGEAIPVNVSVTEYASAGKTKYLTTIVDETQRIILEQAKSDFFSMVSHDMRTPLTSISGVLQLAIAGGYGPVPDTISKKLELARSSSNLLLRMISRLLEIERMESSDLELKLEPVDMSSLARQAGELISPQLEEKKLRLEFNAENCLVKADMHYLVEVMLNLLTNSIKYSPQNGNLIMSCRPTDGLAVFELLDQGPGVPADKKESIFERFAQADNRRDRSIGFGLGLSICRKIIAQHGGRIGVKDGPQGGSIFWFSLPLQ